MQILRSKNEKTGVKITGKKVISNDIYSGSRRSDFLGCKNIIC